MKDLSDLEKEIEPTASKTRGVHSAAIFHCLSCLHVEHLQLYIAGKQSFLSLPGGNTGKEKEVKKDFFAQHIKLASRQAVRQSIHISVLLHLRIKDTQLIG